jgi:hypothetical protein
VIDEPLVVFTEHHGRYRVEFDYHPVALTVLKKTVPAPMRRFMARFNSETERWEPLPGESSKFWEISTDWVGPLASAIINSGIEVLGFSHANIGDWFSVFSAAMPTSPSGHRAYRKGFCKSCESLPHRPGGVECEDCYHKRLVLQHRVKAALAESRATRYPEALPAGGKSAYLTRYPLEIDRADVSIVARDHAAVLDILIAAEHGRSTCLICGRRPPKRVAVHGSCRTRLLHVLDDRPFSRARNKAFQGGACAVCFTRPHTGRVACAHCAELVDVCQSLRIANVVPTTPVVRANN